MKKVLPIIACVVIFSPEIAKALIRVGSADDDCARQAGFVLNSPHQADGPYTDLVSKICEQRDLWRHEGKNSPIAPVVWSKIVLETAISGVGTTRNAGSDRFLQNRETSQAVARRIWDDYRLELSQRRPLVPPEK